MRHCKICGESWNPYEEQHDCAVKTTEERLQCLEGIIVRLCVRVTELERKAEKDQ